MINKVYNVLIDRFFLIVRFFFMVVEKKLIRTWFFIYTSATEFARARISVTEFCGARCEVLSPDEGCGGDYAKSVAKRMGAIISDDSLVA